MSDPNAPNDPNGGDAVDPVDRAYAEAEAMLRDDAERAARRARILAAVAADQAEPAPVRSPVVSDLPPPRRTARSPAPWLLAAGVAGVATLVGLRVAPPDMWRPPQIEPAPTAPKASAVPEATPSPSPPPIATAAAPAAPSMAKAEPPPVQSRAPVAFPLDEAPPPPLPIPPVQRRADAAAPAPPPPTPLPLPLPPAASRVETPAPPAPPPPLPIPPVARRAETSAPSAAMAIGPAFGETQRPMLIPNPVWVRRPSREDIAQYYPVRAQRTETNGSATISCTVRANGTLADCTVVAEAPADYGFGEAALRMARIFRVYPTAADGMPTAGRTVRERIEFKAPN